MITVIKEDKFRVGACNACIRDRDKPFAIIYEISFRYEGSHQSNSIRLCPKCLRELTKKIKETK